MAERDACLQIAPECHGCGVCLAACPRGAISLLQDRDRFRAVIEPARCDLCLACVDVCPVEAILEPYPPAWRSSDGA